MKSERVPSLPRSAPSDLAIERTNTSVFPRLEGVGLQQQLIAVARDLNSVNRKERARSEELQRALTELEESYFATVKTLAFVVEAKDVHTRSHLSRAHDYAVALAQRVAPDLADDRLFRYGSLLHDIGKVGIPETILRKPDALTDEEWDVMRTHPIIGAQILKPIRFLERAIPIVECHHERYDGGGYPRGLAGVDIPLAARIFSVVDTFDALTSERPYRRACTVDEAISEIIDSAGSQFDPAVAHSFARLCRERGSAWPLDQAHRSDIED